MDIFAGIMIPFIGTAAGAGCVFFLRGNLNPSIQKMLLGFASGVMVAASVWSLLIPAMDMSQGMEKLAFIPAAVGFLLGIVFLLAMDKLIPHLHLGSDKPEGRASNWKKSTMLVLAVTLHNIPEGMAVGVVFAGMLSGDGGITAAGAMALSLIHISTGYILCANPGLSEEMAEAISSTLPGLKDDSMWKTLLNTTFKGGSWEYAEREEGIQIVKDMQIFCDDLGLGV